MLPQGGRAEDVTRWHRNLASAALLCAAAGVAVPAHADEPLMQRFSYSGGVDFFATGAPMAIDGPDPDTTRVDLIAQPASVIVTTSDVPSTAILQQAFLYWGGSITDDGCMGNTIDDMVDFTPPSNATTPIIADVCYCSDANAVSYDIQVCRKDISLFLADFPLAGTYTVDKFAALINNGSTNNASFSIVIVFSETNLPPRRIALYDGNETLHNSSKAMTLSVNRISTASKRPP